MGEMADYHNDPRWLPLQTEDELLYYIATPLPKPQFIHCKYCGKGKLKWKFVEEHGWRLYNKNIIHSCEAYKQAKAEATQEIEEEILLHAY